MDVLERIREQVEGNPVVIYMKGTPQFPQCGFSARAAAALQDCGRPFAYVNVLADPEIFENLPRYANWPTFPQIYVDGELIGGCDITLELHASGELQKMVKQATAGQETGEGSPD
jgi:monothiol glutaredoxin